MRCLTLQPQQFTDPSDRQVEQRLAAEHTYVDRSQRMKMEYDNATQNFLGGESLWSDARVELNDVQGLWGGLNISVAGTRRAVVQRVLPGMMELRYEFELDAAAWRRLLEVLVANDFVTIRPAERPGIPDEARPRITLVNAANDRRSVAKWAGVEDARFEAVYRALMQVESLTGSLEPVRVEPEQDSMNPAVAAHPFTAMGMIRTLLQQRAWDRTPDGARLEEILTAAASLEAVSAWAAQMQLGAEGYDNTTSAHAYGDIQEHLISATREIERACMILCKLASAY